MIEEIKKYNNFYHQVESNFLNKDHFFHAYIIETSDNDQYEKIIIDLVKLIFSKEYLSNNDDDEIIRICNLIDNDNFSDFQKVFPQNQVIKKEQLNNVKSKFKTKSFNNTQVYVVFEADKMNKETSNTILKFLEEPSEGVVAILVVKNRYMLLDTIISRCQILTMDNVENTSDLSDDVLVHFFEIFSSIKNIFLNYNKILEELFVDKKETVKILDLLEKKYYNYICNEKSIENSNEIILKNMKSMDTNSILKLIEIISEEKKKLRYNVNFKLWLDNFIIKFMEVKEDV